MLFARALPQRGYLLIALLAPVPGSAIANEAPFPCDGPAFNRILDHIKDGTTRAQTQAFLEVEAIAYTAFESVSDFRRDIGVRQVLRIDAAAVRRADGPDCRVETTTIGFDANDEAIWLHCAVGTERMPCEPD